jgi:hypothetical protein
MCHGNEGRSHGLSAARTSYGVLHLADVDPNTDGVQADCTVFWRYSLPDPKDPTKVVWKESPTPLPQCPEGATSGNIAEDCWQLVSDTTRCPKNGQWLDILRTAAEIASQPQLVAGTKLHARCRV